MGSRFPKNEAPFCGSGTLLIYVPNKCQLPESSLSKFCCSMSSDGLFQRILAASLTEVIIVAFTVILLGNVQKRT
jgi:hypothetical protein